ncbi:hypothetical protein [Patulibacter americanus]|uniref:hypothetical protein n=1 Tax=Patulibacter americanus TaxID=588672 RepID=UPI0003B7AB75|nr:hypothetical protein [Patulibacter americanus]
MSITEQQDERDLEWLAERRPRGVELDEAATRRARAALMTDMAGGAPRGAAARRPKRRRRVVRLALGGVAVGGLAVAVLATGGPQVTTQPGADGPSSARLRLIGGPPAADAAPLERLTTRLRARAARATASLPGDASLIVRHQDGATVGADLFTDDGVYYYAGKPDGLAAAIADQKADKDLTADRSFVGRAVAAAEAAFDGPIEAARERMGDAAFVPGRKPSNLEWVRGDDGEPRAVPSKTSPPVPTRAEAAAWEENRIWVNSMDALNGGAARPAVRAGVLHLLGTLSSVKVTKATEGDRQVLVLAARQSKHAYTERLTVDAGTGMPIRFTGREDGESEPAVKITYDVSRVTLADIVRG